MTDVYKLITGALLIAALFMPATADWPGIVRFGLGFLGGWLIGSGSKRLYK